MTRFSMESSLRSLSCAAIFTALSGFAVSANAQDDAEATKVIPTIRTLVYDRLTAAQECMDLGDDDCIENNLQAVERIRDLNNYERAQLWRFRAFHAFDSDDLPAAISAYEEILAIPHEDMPDGMIQETMRNVATLYLNEERYPEALAQWLEYMDLPSVEPAPEDYYRLATIHYSMEQYEEGIPAVRSAIDVASQYGEEPEESWYQLLYVFYFQLEQTDNVIETLTYMVEHWTKREWILALAGQLSSQDRQDETLTLYEAAYEAGMLTRGNEFVQLANMYLNQGAPYKAAVLLQSGLEDGTIESTESNWRTLAQAWQIAWEHEKAIPAFERASELSNDGNIDRLLTQSFMQLARWEDCADSARRALDRGGIDREDLLYMNLGNCLMNMSQYREARAAFVEAAKDDRVADNARQFIRFNDDLIRRDEANAEALASLAQN